jgi:hypothetical protein
MNMNLPIPSPARPTSRRGIRALLVTRSPASRPRRPAASPQSRSAGSGASLQDPVGAWAGAHYPDAYLTSHPLLLAACCALIAAATALAAARRRVPVTLLLCAAAVMPWAPAMAFLHHVWQLAPAS